MSSYLLDNYGYGNGGGSSYMSMANWGKSPDWGWQDYVFGAKDANGNQIGSGASAALGLFNTGMNAYLGLKQLKLGQETLDFQRGSFYKQFEANRRLTNARLRDRQAARVSADPTTHESVESYMKRNGI